MFPLVRKLILCFVLVFSYFAEAEVKMSAKEKKAWDASVKRLKKHEEKMREAAAKEVRVIPPPANLQLNGKMMSFDAYQGMGDIAVGGSRTFDLNWITKNSAANLVGIRVLSATITGTPEIAITGDSCTGNTYGPNSPCSIYVTFAPTSLGIKRSIFDIVVKYFFNDGSTSLDYGTIHFSNASLESTVRCEKKAKGSIIGVDGRILGESIPVVGTDFNLHYTSANSPQYTTTSGRLADDGAKEFFNKEGWTFSNQHYYSGTQGRLFFGDGSSAKIESTFDSGLGNFVLVNPNQQEIFVFDSSGKHLETRTYLTGAIRYLFTYDLNNRLVKITDAFGNETILNRNLSGQLTSIVSPFGITTSIGLNGDGLIASVTNANSETYTMTYKTGTALLETFTKPAGQVSQFSYNSSGLLTQDLGNGGDLWNFGINSSGDITKTSQMGRQSVYDGHRLNQLNYVRNSKEADTFGDFYNQSDFGNTRWSPLESGYTALGADKRLGYSNLVLIRNDVTYTDPINLNSVLNSTQFSQDVTYAGTTTPGLFNFSTLTDYESRNGKMYLHSFDNTTKTSTFTTPSGAISKIFYNALEFVTGMQTGTDTPVTTTYNTAGQVTQVSQSGQNETNFTYATNGFLQSMTNARSETTSFTYDLAGRILTTTLPDSRVITKTYDANGNLSSITPPGKTAHTFLFNAMELPSTYQPPFVTGVSPKDTTYNYNLDRQLTSISRPDGKSVAYSYDNTTGLLQKVSTDLGDYIYYYIVGNRVQLLISPYDVSNYYSYLGPKLLSVDFQDYNGRIGRVSTTYNNDFLPMSKRVYGADDVTFALLPITRNDDGMPTTYGDMNLSYSYPSGRLATTTLGLSTDERTYDQYGNLATYTAKYNGTVIYAYTLTRDVMSKITGVSETINGVTSNYEYFFDTSGRLTSVKKNSTQIASFTYDSNGNRTSSTIDGGTYSATFDSQDRMITYGGTSYLYNKNGDLTQSQTSYGLTKTFDYDSLGNMNSSSVASTIYKYRSDGLNRFVASAEYPSGVPARYYIYGDQLRIYAELNASRNLDKTFVYATDEHSPDYMLKDGFKYRVIKNHLGSPRLVIKVSDGSVAEQIDYNIFGRVTKDTNTCFVPFGFAGGLRDRFNGLVKFGARYYDPETGRWTTKDPIRFDGGDTNLYGYVLQDPVNGVDPSGLDPGDTFDSADLAVIDAFKYILKTKKDSDAREYGGRIQKSNGKYSYSSIVCGNSDHVEMDYNYFGLGRDVAEFHTHLPNSNHDIGNSSGDEFHAILTRIPSYVLSPLRNSIDVYNPPGLFGSQGSNRQIGF